MHVGIDITSLIYGRGVSRYTANLVRSLLQYTPAQVSLYGSTLRGKSHLTSEVKAVLESAGPRGRSAHVFIQSYPPTVQNFLWNTLGQNSIKKNLPQVEVFHSWDWLQPPDKDLALVSTIHDLAILAFPETAHPKILKMHQLAWKKLKARNAHIIAISRTTRKDVIEKLDYPSELVHVIYEALPQEFINVSRVISEEKHEILKNKMQLYKPFVLFVGTREPRKNLSRLIEAWLPLSSDLELIVAGMAGWDDSIKQAQKVMNPNLRLLGKVTDQELAVLYSEAEVFAYPSLYEGFGLPILEAFYYGTPVLTSQVSSMVEVAGNAAELINPLSVASIRTGLQNILNEPLPDQQKRLQRMIIRLQMFDWQRVALETLAVYQTALDQRK